MSLRVVLSVSGCKLADGYSAHEFSARNAPGQAASPPETPSHTPSTSSLAHGDRAAHAPQTARARARPRPRLRGRACPELGFGTCSDVDETGAHQAQLGMRMSATSRAGNRLGGGCKGTSGRARVRGDISLLGDRSSLSLCLCLVWRRRGGEGES